MFKRTLIGCGLWMMLGVMGCESSPATMEDLMPAAQCLADKPASVMCQPFTGALSSCKCSSDDYAPRYNGSKNDTWPTCVSDGNAFVLFGTSTPGASARTVAFVSMGTKLWKHPAVPSAQEMTAARDEYAVANGIGSRVARRQDIHYPEVPGTNKFACNDLTIAAQNPDRCAGPAKLKAIIDDAFAKGIAGTKPQVQSARIEAALLWFFYLSSLSEVWTSSFDNAADVDSAWAYLSGTERSKPIGLGQYFQQLDQETYDRAFDAVLAARCWRDLDKTLPSGCNLFYQRAASQVDKAFTRGMALILRDRIGKLPTLSGEPQEAALSFVNIIGLLLDRAARAVDPAKADQLKTSTQAATVSGVNVGQAQSLIDGLFGCP